MQNCKTLKITHIEMWTVKVALVIACFGAGFCSMVARNNLTVEEEDVLIHRKYLEMDALIKDFVISAIKSALPMLMEANEGTSLSSSCMGNIFQLMTELRKLKLSALKFIDATGKPSEGFLNGNMHMLGDYDQCLNTTILGRRGRIAFRGQYCLIHYRPILPRQKRPVTFHSGIEELVEAAKNTSELVRFLLSQAQLFYYNPSKFGMCVPSGCKKEDVDQIVAYLGDRMYLDANVEYCDMDDENFMNTKNIVFTCIFVSLGIFTIIGTSLDTYSKERNVVFKNLFLKGLMCFSVLTNFPRAISTETSDGSIPCLHGLRALTLFYVILLHQYYAVVKYFISSHMMKMLEEVPRFFMQIITNGFLTADVFFFIGGLVNCYSRMRMKDNEKRKRNVLLLISHRLWRIGPVYFFFCLMESLFRPYGPMRLYEKKEYVDKCDKFWWQNALFINNFFTQDDTCSPHSWYIAADMQLFWLSLFTVPLFFKKPNLGIIVNCIIIFLGIFFTVVWSWITNITPAVIFYRPNVDEINKAWNANTYSFPHIASYFTGVVIGYFLSVKKDSIQIPKLYQILGWFVAAFLFTSILFVTKVWNSGGAFYAADSSFYYGLSKFLFALAIAWMVLNCVSGNGGIINYVLSLPLWIPISRISYVVYLVAPFLQTFYFANSRTIVDGHRMTLIWRYAGDTSISLILGLVLYVLVEASFSNLEKLLFDKWSRKKERSRDEKTLPKYEVELGHEQFSSLHGLNLQLK